MFTIKTKASKTYDVTADVAVMAGDGQMTIAHFSGEGFATGNVIKVKRLIKQSYVDDGNTVLGISNVNVSPVDGKTTIYKFDASRADVIAALVGCGIEFTTTE